MTTLFQRHEASSIDRLYAATIGSTIIVGATV
jgi:hypothetical protein